MRELLDFSILNLNGLSEAFQQETLSKSRAVVQRYESLEHTTIQTGDSPTGFLKALPQISGLSCTRSSHRRTGCKKEMLHENDWFVVIGSKCRAIHCSIPALAVMLSEFDQIP